MSVPCELNESDSDPLFVKHNVANDVEIIISNCLAQCLHMCTPNVIMLCCLTITVQSTIIVTFMIYKSCHIFLLLVKLGKKKNASLHVC